MTFPIFYNHQESLNSKKCCGQLLSRILATCCKRQRNLVFFDIRCCEFFVEENSGFSLRNEKVVTEWSFIVSNIYVSNSIITTIQAFFQLIMITVIGNNIKSEFFWR